MGRMNDPITFLKVGEDGEYIKPPGMSEKEFAVHRESALAWRHYHKTGDKSLLRKAGILPPEEGG